MGNIDNATRGTEMSLIGKLICAWKGSHKWRRPRKSDGLRSDIRLKICDRCAVVSTVTRRKVNVEGGGNG